MLTQSTALLSLGISVEGRRQNRGQREDSHSGRCPGPPHRRETLDTPHPHPLWPSCFSCRSDAPEEALLASVFKENLDFDHSLSMCQGAPHTRPRARLWRCLLSRSGPGLAEDGVCLQRRQTINSHPSIHSPKCQEGGTGGRDVWSPQMSLSQSLRPVRMSPPGRRLRRWNSVKERGAAHDPVSSRGLKRRSQEGWSERRGEGGS